MFHHVQIAVSDFRSVPEVLSRRPRATRLRRAIRRLPRRLAAGGRDHGAPGPRPDYSATYWAAFVLDPDGNNLEAVV